MRDRMAGVVLRIALSVIAGGAAGRSAPLVFCLTTTSDLDRILRRCRSPSAVVVADYRRSWRSGVIDEDIFKRRVLVYGAGNNALRLVAAAPPRRPARLQSASGSCRPKAKTVVVPEDRVVRDQRTRHGHEYARLNARSTKSSSRWTTGAAVSAQGSARLPAGRHRSLELVTFLERETGKVHLDMLTPSWIIFGGGFRRDVLRALLRARSSTCSRASRCCCWRCRSCC